MIYQLALLRFLFLLNLLHSNINGQNVTATISTSSTTTSSASKSSTSTSSISTSKVVEGRTMKKEVPPKMEGRIVNGEKAKQGQFPFIISIQRTNLSPGHFCGGTLITDKWIVTAAHCIAIRNNRFPSDSQMFLVAGEIDINVSFSPTRQYRRIRKLIINPRYNANSLENDIGVLMADKPFDLTQFVSPISLSKTLPQAGLLCTVAGWGYTSEDNSTINRDLMHVKVPIISNENCRKLLSGIIYISSSRICAGYMEGQKDSCQGDSGGPLVCDNSLAGTVSGGKGCARPKLPGFYASIPTYRDWIEQIIRSNGENETYAGITKYPSYAHSPNGSIRYFQNLYILIYSFFIILLMAT